MDKDYLALKRASTSRPSGEWNDDVVDVVCDGVVVGRSMKAAAAPVGEPWLWTLAFGQHEDRWPIYGYEATRRCDGGVRQELAAGIAPPCHWRARWCADSLIGISAMCGDRKSASVAPRTCCGHERTGQPTQPLSH